MKRSSSARTRRQLDSLLDSFFFCPSCTTWRTSAPVRSSIRRTLHPPRRYASTLSSSTAVNATKSLPPRYKPLYEALGNLKKKASAQVNLSRLQLALQGLESESPATRIAVLGLNVQDTSRRVVRLLLADALEDEGLWERQVLDQQGDFSEGLLIRYGQPPNPNLPQPRTSIPVLYVPSNVLERNNMEILVSTMSGPRAGELLQGAQTFTSDAFLSPAIGTPTAFNGRQTMIRQPVHSCLLVTKDLDELFQAAELLASTNFTTLEDRESVRIAVHLDSVQGKATGKVLITNLSWAEEGLDAIRRSVTEATTYEHKWVESGMPSLSSWLTAASAARSENTIPKPVKMLISSLLTTATMNLEFQASLDARSTAARSLSSSTKSNLEDAIEEFSRKAHQELQSGLASAWGSRNWRKLAWYKLFWRVDDVGLVVTDLVTNAWLPHTERAVYEISGRLSQAGVSPTYVFPSQPRVGGTTTLEARAPHETEPATVLQAQASVAAHPRVKPVLVNRGGSTEVKMAPVPQPVPLSSSISRLRAEQMDRAIASLTSTAQQIVLKTLSITGLSAGLSALTYLSLTPGSLYEASTVVALGTAFALWRMQGDWFRATKAMEDGLFDEGRTVVQRIVGRMRELVESASRIQEDNVEVQSRREAENAVQRAREELDRLEK